VFKLTSLACKIFSHVRNLRGNRNKRHPHRQVTGGPHPRLVNRKDRFTQENILVCPSAPVPIDQKVAEAFTACPSSKVW
jgi:hypothetical protein